MDEGNDNRPIRPCRANMDVRGGNVDDVAYYHSERYCGAIVNEPDRRHSKRVSSYRPCLLAPSKVDVKCHLMDFTVFVRRFKPLMFGKCGSYLDRDYEDR